MLRIALWTITGIFLSCTNHDAALAVEPESPKLNWSVSSTGSTASLRGLSVVNATKLWACGSQGTVVRSTDGGLTWSQCGPADYPDLEFRSITAFDEQVACIASAGTPAVILRTNDGGKTWREVYRHNSPAAFFDGLRFWDTQRGLVFSDPVGGRLLVVRTEDGGITWREIAPEAIPLARETEAGFAASNSSLRLGKEGEAWIGTGGTAATDTRIYRSHDFGTTWSTSQCPIPSGASEGVFSIVKAVEGDLLVAVGGDYRPNVTSKLTATLSSNDGRTWQAAARPPTDFVSAVCSVVQVLNKEQNSVAKIRFIATGPTKTYCSQDGTNWSECSDLGFHAIEAIPERTIFAVGSEGRFGKLTVP